MCCSGAKSRKWGKKVCHGKFRVAVRSGKLVFRLREVMETWALGGDGKYVYTWDTRSEDFKRWTRK